MEKPQFDNRQRFNWGYHDGVAVAKRGQSRAHTCLGTRLDTHFDQVYAAGHFAGYDAHKQGLPVESSVTAWEESKIPSGHSLRPHVLMGRDSSGRKIAPWMPGARV
jgi:hypothetical protein